MQVVSVNIGKAQPIQNAKAVGKTGIYKRPVDIPARVTTLGLVDDAICDTPNHGGVDQAVYVYGVPDYQWWTQELGYDLEPGTFGENLTITELESAQMRVGDRLHIGEVIFEITAPRIPCVTLARRMNDPAFAKRFRAAERPGVYCRVITAGSIQAGQAVTYEPYRGDTVTVMELFRAAFEAHHDEATLRRHLAAPIAIRDRTAKEEKLRKLVAT
ncbi:MAG: MOSC domain-containing protein [Herpetosiphonaceae bacterium]|nr:MOSC domain-containing protein [Herpetosiphonaceae bacterium]